MPNPLLMPSPRQRFVDNNGDPLVNGMVFTYAAGTSTLLPTYQDAAGLVPHQNPIRLDQRGEATVYWDTANYKIDLKTQAGNQVPGYPVDNFNATDRAADGIAAVIASFFSNSGATLVGFLQAGAGAIKRTVQDKLRDHVSVKDFGAKGDGVTDDTAAIQAALSARNAAGGGKLLFTAGTYKVSSTLLYPGSNLVITGDSKGATTIRGTIATGDIICIGDGTSNPNNCVIENMSIDSTVAKTSGAGIHFRNGHNLQIRNVRIDNNMFKGIILDGGPQHFIYHLDNLEVNSGSICGLEIGGDGTVVADTFISNVVISGTAGINILFASGLYMSKVDVIGCTTYGIGLIPSSGKLVASSFFDTVLGDTCVNQGWLISPTGTGTVTDISFQNCWGSSTTNPSGAAAGLFIDAPTAAQVSNLQFTNFRAVNNTGTGITVNNGKFITFSNCVASGNSQSASAFAPGMNLNGAALTDIQVHGGVYGGKNTLPSNQSYGITFGGACDYIQIIGVNLRGNVTGGINNASTGTHNVVVNNV